VNWAPSPGVRIAGVVGALHCSNTFSAAIVLLLTIFFVSPGHTIEKSVEANGESPFSKEDAIRQAQRLAVEKALGVFVLSETEIENFRLKKNRVFSHLSCKLTI